MYTVEKITTYKGNPKGKKSDLYFEVHWTRFEEPAWEPWKNVRRLAELHSFLKNHTQKNVRDLLPTNYLTQIK